MKAIIIQGCHDCPYLYEVEHGTLYCGKIGIKQAHDDLYFPHPDCKLPDLPTPGQIDEKAQNVASYNDGIFPSYKRRYFTNGAKWVIKKISK